MAISQAIWGESIWLLCYVRSVLNISKGLIGKPAGCGGGKADGGQRRGSLGGVHSGSSETGIRGVLGACFSWVPWLFQVELALLRFVISLRKIVWGVLWGQIVHEGLKNIYFLISVFFLERTIQYNEISSVISAWGQRQIADATAFCLQDQLLTVACNVLCSLLRPRLRPSTVVKLPGLSDDNPDDKAPGEITGVCKLGKLTYKYDPNTHRQ